MIQIVFISIVSILCDFLIVDLSKVSPEMLDRSPEFYSNIFYIICLTTVIMKCSGGNGGLIEDIHSGVYESISTTPTSASLILTENIIFSVSLSVIYSSIFLTLIYVFGSGIQLDSESLKMISIPFLLLSVIILYSCSNLSCSILFSYASTGAIVSNIISTLISYGVVYKGMFKYDNSFESVLMEYEASNIGQEIVHILSSIDISAIAVDDIMNSILITMVSALIFSVIAVYRLKSEKIFFMK